MAVYDLEEQEQIDEFKAWWNQYRNIVTLLVVAVLLTLTGMQGCAIIRTGKRSRRARFTCRCRPRPPVTTLRNAVHRSRHHRQISTHHLRLIRCARCGQGSVRQWRQDGRANAPAVGHREWPRRGNA